MAGFQKGGLRGEVIVADNGSTDGSVEIAEPHGARVVRVPSRGYGAALKVGITSARGTYIIMGDADDSYDFSEVPSWVEHLRQGHDLVMGNRFKGGIFSAETCFYAQSTSVINRISPKGMHRL